MLSSSHRSVHTHRRECDRSRGGSESNVCGLKTSDGEGETEIFKHIQNAYNRQTDTYDGYKESWAESKLPTPRERRVNKLQWIDTYSHVCKSNTSEPTYPLTNK